ncbi:MAG: hypothetical protein V3T38_06745 [Gammaproteobacteria bacterium]
MNCLRRTVNEHEGIEGDREKPTPTFLPRHSFLYHFPLQPSISLHFRPEIVCIGRQTENFREMALRFASIITESVYGLGVIFDDLPS